MELNFNHLHYFHVAAIEGSVAGAAERLGVTQPTVSGQLRLLEESLGVTLFERGRNGIKLTDAGRIVFEHTSVMFRAGERLVESLLPRPAFPSTLRVGLSSAASRATSSDFLLPLLALDDCVPTISVGDMTKLLGCLMSSELDLVLCESEPPMPVQSDLQTSVIAQIALVAVAAPSIDPLPGWQNLSLLHYRPSSPYRTEIDRFLGEKGYTPRIAGEVDDPLFLVEAAVRGSHVAFVPQSVARDAITARRARVLARIEPAAAGVYAVYRAGLAQRAVETLIASRAADSDE